ncbi:hypothetical protein CTI12_AA350630 [Artemisia annua]|uniref:DUF674 family protein n=1 Tax=Artemisia annua TaxID=35608 RepID=A0A2U1MR33_ARTAN|nr:hypothetical protein CTI12_AA350630 [Artemisia annua]
MATTTERAKISLKLMVHKEHKRVIFAEADNHFVDTLFSFMTLPMGTIIRLLEKVNNENIKALGNVNNLFHSLVNFPDNYMSNEEIKYMLLYPRSSSHDHCRKLKLNIDDTEPIKYFVCETLGCRNRLKTSYSTCAFARCIYCGNQLIREIKKKGSDLPANTGAAGLSIQLLCAFGITDGSQVEERTLDMVREQILVLLKGALLFKYPLSYLVYYSTHRIQNLVTLRQGTLIYHFNSNEVASIPKKIMLKVTLQKSNSKFLFAEADGDFVDFLFGFLEIPLGTVIGKLLNGNSSLESMDNLFSSISNMHIGYLKSQDLKNALLQPQLSWDHVSQNHTFKLNASNLAKIFFHNECIKGTLIMYLTHFYDPPCVGCDQECYELTFKDPKVLGGVLKAPAKFMVTDDLNLTPVSSVSTIALLNKLKVPLNDVEEHEVSIGVEEGLKILKASLKSSTPLSDVLLKGCI